MKVIYEALKQRILDKVTAIQDVRLFNNQIQNMESGSDTLYLPSVLIEFTDVEYGHKNHLNQYGKGVLKFYIVTEDYNGSPETAFDIWENINRCLNRYTDGVNFYPLERIGEEHDTDFTNIYVYTISFELNFIHYLTPETPADVTSMMVDLQITKGETTVVVPVHTEPAKVVNPNTDEVLYLDKGDVYNVPVESHEPVTITDRFGTTIQKTDGETYTESPVTPVTITDRFGTIVKKGEGETYTETPVTPVTITDRKGVIVKKGEGESYTEAPIIKPQVVDGTVTTELSEGEVFNVVHTPVTITDRKGVVTQKYDGESYTEAPVVPVTITDRFGTTLTKGEGETYTESPVSNPTAIYGTSSKVLTEGSTHTFMHKNSIVNNPNTNETISLGYGQNYDVPLIQDEISLVATFPVDADNTMSITITTDTATTYQNNTLSNVATVAYTNNTVAATLPITVVAGDVLGVTITRTVATTQAQIIMKNM